MSKQTINKLSYTVGRTKFVCPDADKIKHIEVSLSNKNYLCISIDEDGDIVITSNSNKQIKVLSHEENQLVINLK
jgi:hypothetical protein